MKNNFKSFTPKADVKRRLVLIRFYIGINGSNGFYYRINKITKKGSIDKRFKHLYAIGSDDFDSIEDFKASTSGEVVRVFKTAFKSVFGLKDKQQDVLEVWNAAINQPAKPKINSELQAQIDAFNQL